MIKHRYNVIVGSVSAVEARGIEFDPRVRHIFIETFAIIRSSMGKKSDIN